MLALIVPAQAQQVIQLPLCEGTLPSSINPSAATIGVNPQGDVCISSRALGTTSDSVAVSPTANSTVISLLKAILTNVLSPINVTGSFSTTVSSPLGVNIAATTPINVTVASSPLNVTGSFSTSVSSPLGVNIASSPVNVTGNLSVTPASPQNVNLDQINGQLIASPSTYGVAPVGSVGAVNAFVTNNVNVTSTPAVSPQNVTVGTPTVVLSGSPVSVGIAGPTPLNVTLATIPGSPQAVQLTGSTVTLAGSPVSVGIAGPTPLNVTVAGATNLNVSVLNAPNVSNSPQGSPQNVTINSSPQAMTLTAGQVYLSLQPASNVIAYSVTSQFALPSSPGTLIVSGPHQLARVYCALRPPITNLTTQAYLRIYDTTSTQVATGSQRIFLLLAATGLSVLTQNSVNFTAVAPGEQFSNGIVAIMASTQNGTIFGTGTSLNTETTDCTFAYN